MITVSKTGGRGSAFPAVVRAAAILPGACGIPAPARLLHVDGRDRRIVTTYWAKPVPSDQFDWEATFADYDEGDAIGFGASEEAAIANLIEEVEFRHG